jgi:hypothetical protein
MNYILTTTLASLFCVFICGSVAGQNESVPHQLANTEYLTAISSVYGNEWVSNNPDGVAALDNCFTKRMRYQIEPLTEYDKYPLLSSFPLMNRYNPAIVAINYSEFNPGTFIPITYNLPFFSDLMQIIRVDGTDYIIVIEPIKTQH